MHDSILVVTSPILQVIIYNGTPAPPSFQRSILVGYGSTRIMNEGFRLRIHTVRNFLVTAKTDVRIGCFESIEI